MSGLNTDYSARVLMRSADMEWVKSPAAGVWRKRLELLGRAEDGRVTSVVRYDANAAFPEHDHPGGEEILVLAGVFSDDHGDYPAGTFLLNPEGFRHAPGSAGGCVLLVKLRQYPGAGRRHVLVDSNTGTWTPGSADGVEVMPLYAEDGYPERIHLTRIAAGAAAAPHEHAGGEEVYVLEGGFTDEDGTYQAGDWLRYPPASRHAPRSSDGCLLYVKTGHLEQIQMIETR